MSKKLIIVSSLVFVALTIGGVYVWSRLVTVDSNNTTASSSSDQTGDPVLNSQVLQSLQSKDFKDARTLAETGFDKEPSMANRRLRVNVEIADSNYQKAIDLLLGADQSKLNSDDYGNLGVCYEKLGDKTKAAEAYRKSAELWPLDDPMHDAEGGYLRNVANSLEGKYVEN